MVHDSNIPGKVHLSLEKSGFESEEVILVDAPHPLLIREPRPLKQPKRVEIHDFVARADEYVTVSPEGFATVAAAIRKVMTPIEVQWVEHMVGVHNLMSRPNTLLLPRGGGNGRPDRPDPGEGTIPKHPGSHSGTPSDTGTTSQGLGDPPAPCVPHVTITFYWWGFRIYMDHCFCRALVPFSAVTGAASTVIGLLAAAGVSVANPYIALAAGLIAMMIGWITWADGYCTPNMGANYNQSWTVQGWITTVC